ncbi:nitroreductase family protein [candidate division KSB1 bacterium]|nr:nitroreductase family protein [candidate division KSB1 bacterium]
MDLFDAIRQRFSYRGAFLKQSVPREDLEAIVQAGLDAPSGKNMQTTSFIIVDDPELLDSIRAIASHNKPLQSCLALICCVIDQYPEPIYHDFSFQIEDCSAAVENMLLAITALEYRSVWLDGMLRLESCAEKIGAILGIPPNKKLQIMMPVGLPAEEYPRREKRLFHERAWFNGWKHD